MVNFTAFAILFAVVYVGDFLLFFIERRISITFDPDQLASHDFKDLTWQSGNLGKGGEWFMILINWVFLTGIILFLLPALDIPRNGASFFILIFGTVVGAYIHMIFIFGTIARLARYYMGANSLEEYLEEVSDRDSFAADIEDVATRIPGAFPFTFGFFCLIASFYELFRWLFSEVIAIPAAASLGGLVIFGWCAAWLGIQADKPPNLDRTLRAEENSPGLEPGQATEDENSQIQSTHKSSLDHSGSDITSHVAESSVHTPRTTGSADFSGTEYGWGYSTTRFDDIGGYYELKRALTDEIIQPLQAVQREDDRFSRFGIDPERGVLFFGPPGTGKTMFARALAGELRVPFVELSPADVTSQWINEGPEKIRQLFAEAKSIGPCVIFIDEAEHLFGARAAGSRNTHAEDRKMTTEFLVHLTREDRETIVVAATNRPEDIDPAILRPGRLTAQFEIELPDSESRHAVLQSKLAGVPSVLSGTDLAEIAEHTTGFSGAELTELVDDAKRAAAKRDADAVTRADFLSTQELDEIVTRNSASTDESESSEPDEESAFLPSENEYEGSDSSVGYQ
ncbi:ATP-binding protein (plasmid) [Halorientalis pallida]|uniref:ATP-binding protein n=1 Tax=Halorientalis pallida TaxID=2479928 RepID=UPI003C6EF0F4